MTDKNTPSLGEYVGQWLPPADIRTELISLGTACDLAASLDLEQNLVDGGPLPPLWQCAYFLDRVPTQALGVDGHPRHGAFLPAIPHRRRMFAGGRVRVLSPLIIGEPAVRHTQLIEKTVKQARTRELLFVTLRHEYSQRGEPLVSEEQDLVYRSDASNSTQFTLATEPLAPQTTPWSSTPETTSTLLFRFSALTGNAHRIHYDGAYTTAVEGFPALVVHGPLLAIYIAELARANARTVKTFHFRLKHPVFLGDRFRVQGGHPAETGAATELSIVSGSGTVHATASFT